MAGLYSFTSLRNETRKLTSVDIEFEAGNNLFITHQSVNKLLIQNEDNVTSIAKERVVLNTLENALNANEMIQHAEVYLTVDGRLGAKIKQRTPIARVIKNRSFYIDLEGRVMPLSPSFSARVPMVTGTIDTKNVADIHTLAKYIYQDEFLKKNVTEIHKAGNAFELRLRVDDFSVTVGKAEELEKKFNNFKAFYQKAMKDKNLDTYKKVDLQFNSQVVCTKK